MGAGQRRRNEQNFRRRLRLDGGATSAGGGAGGGFAFSHPFVVLGGLLILGILLGVLHNSLRARGKSDPLLSVVRVGLSPAQKSAAMARAGISLNVNALTRGRELEAENVRLATENARLQAENQSLQAQAAETERLRADLHLSRTAKKPLLAADILAWLPTPDFDTIVIAQGTRNGVHEQTVARTADGLLGQVIDTGPNTSVVMLLTDLHSGVGALVRRNGKTMGTGILQGMGRSLPLEIQSLKREDDVRVGDTVVSSGFGSVFPPDVPLGVVTAVRNDIRSEGAGFLKAAQVSPAAPQPGDLRTVLLLP